MHGLAVDGFYDRDCTTISSVNSLPELPEDNGKGLTKLNGGIGYCTVQYSVATVATRVRVEHARAHAFSFYVQNVAQTSTLIN